MDSHEQKIRKGQAYNLAVADAIQQGKQDDTQYIFIKYIRYYELAALIQENDLDLIVEATKSDDLHKMYKELQEKIKGV